MKEATFVGLVVAAVIIGIYYLTSAGNPEAISTTNNPNYVVDELFEHDGCKMNRFKDAGSYVYYSDCSGSTQSKRGKHGKTNVTTTVTEE